MFFGIVLFGLVIAMLRMSRDLSQLRERLGEAEARLDAGWRDAAAPVVEVQVEDPLVTMRPAPPPPLSVPQVERTPEVPQAFEEIAIADPDPDPYPDPVEPSRQRPGFEELFGRKLPIWGGGITLAVAGMLIVKYSVDAGLVSPLVRVICGLLFGSALIGAAEAALRFADRVGDPRIRQALAGAGIAGLYASILVAANLYHLVGPLTAFIGMAAVTALAMGLALRFGAPCALLGLVGGLAAPALVGSDAPDIPLLVTYLAVAIGGLCALSQGQRWMWLGVSALIGGFGWGGALLIGGALDTAASMSVGLYLAVLGIAFPMLVFAPGRTRWLVRLAGSAVAAIQIAMLVAKSGFSLLDWGMFGLISAAIIWLSHREPRLARLPILGLGIILLLLGVWPAPSVGDFTIVLAAGIVLYAVPVLFRLWDDKANEIEAGHIVVIAISVLILPVVHFYRHGSNDLPFALLACAAAMLPAGAAALGWRAAGRRSDARFAMLAAASGLLFALAAGFALPGWSLAPVVAGIGVSLLMLGLRADDMRVEYAAWAFAGFGLLLGLGGDFGDEIARAAGSGGDVDILVALTRWTALAAIFATFAWRTRLRPLAMAAQAVAASLAYGAIAQILPVDILPLLPAIGLVGLAYWSRSLTPSRLLPAMGAVFVLSLGWAAEPLVRWIDAGGGSLIGSPMLSARLPGLQDMALRLLLPAGLIAGALRWTYGRAGIVPFRIAAAWAGLLAGIALHILYKQLFGLVSVDDFVRLGFGERTVWEALLFGGALVAAQRRWWPAAVALAALGFAHFGFYSLLLHNPLWADQAVGSLPIVNLLLPAYGMPFVLLCYLAARKPGALADAGRVISIAQMLLILIFGFTSLRQIAHGSLLAMAGLTPAEDIARSILAIALAIGFLGWGIRRSARDWRIASLVLMIGAVGKVFLLDAAGLDGLMRIGSFVALGFSLIGLGWLYSRYLAPDR